MTRRPHLRIPWTSRRTANTRGKQYCSSVLMHVETILQTDPDLQSDWLVKPCTSMSQSFSDLAFDIDPRLV